MRQGRLSYQMIAQRIRYLSLVILITLALLLLGGVFTLIGSLSLAQTDNARPATSPVASPSPTASPSPSPTPVTGLHQWGAITLFHGLPSDRVRAIAQNNDGTMWFGTESGLAKFDGRRTQVIKDPGLPGSRILSLLTDGDDALWIGTESGAARMVGGQIQNIRETNGATINAIISPERGRILFATEQGNIFEARTSADGSLQVQQLLKQALQSADPDHAGPLPITSLAMIDGKLLAGTLSRGLLLIENGSAREATGRAGYFIRSVNLDNQNKIWIGTRNKKAEPGIFSGDLNALNHNDAATGPVMTIQPMGADVLVGTDGRGVFRFSGNRVERLTFEGTAGGLRSDHVYAIFADREGVIWFGTDRGVCRFDPNAPRVDTLEASPESNFVRTIFRTSNGQLVFAGTNRGLFTYDETKKSWQALESLSRNIIYALAEDDEGRLLVGSASGLYLSDRALNKTTINQLNFTRLEAGSGNADAAGSIRSITHFRGSIVIANFARGVEQLQNGHLKSISLKENTTDVISLFADGDARLIIGTAKEGILFFDGQQVVADPALDQFKGAAVRAITRSKDGTLWFATARGVYTCSNNQCTATAPNVDARSLSPSEYSDNAVWCATTGTGLLKISLDKEVGPVISQLDVEQGLPSQNAFAVITQEKDREILIGTSRGVVRYGPGQTAPALFATRIVSKRVHQPSELSGGLNLEYPQNSLLLDVAAISSRTFPEQFQYEFLLSDSRGQVIRQRISRESQFAMEGLKPGHYRVTARAFTKDLIASEPLSFEFNVAKAPFPWTSTALAILLALTLLALLWALLERRRIVRTSAELVAANRELAGARLDLANEAERERGRIARDLHDQTLADLRHLLLLTDQLPGPVGPAQENGGVRSGIAAGELRTEIEGISQEVRRICEDLSPSVLQNVGFSAALEFALSSALQHAPVNCQFTYDFVCDEALEEKTNLPANVQMQIYRITQEAVNNICRHASPSHVRMEVTASSVGDFLLKIEDDGREFNSGAKRRGDGRGLANMFARASLIEAELSWNKGEGGGTVFTLKKKAAVSAQQSES